MPAFECLTIAFGVGWIVLTLLDRPVRTAAPPAAGYASERWLSWLPTIACALGLSGSNAFHILATHYIPAAEANLISYLWPVEIVAAGALLGLFRLRSRQVIGLALGFAGAVILMAGGKLPPARNVLGSGCALSTALCAGLHFALEPTVMPGLGALGAAAAVGVVPLALGNFVWDEGFRRGDSQLLAVLAYATPLCSALLLAALGMASLTWAVLVGAAIIVTAGILSRAAP
jgi:drug/metabolite transporter (DMT)-like permease